MTSSSESKKKRSRSSDDEHRREFDSYTGVCVERDGLIPMAFGNGSAPSEDRREEAPSEFYCGPFGPQGQPSKGRTYHISANDITAGRSFTNARYRAEHHVSPPGGEYGLWWRFERTD